MDDKELPCAFQDPTSRRTWLLQKALECAPLDRALELARMADDFVLGVIPAMQAEKTRFQPETAVSQSPGRAIPQYSVGARVKPFANKTTAPGRPKLSLSAGQRERLLQRMAEGARNAELATDFGLAPRQVQGIRISQARQAKLRQQQSSGAPAASIEEVVRFLRQQDDLVVRQADGAFLVNGRFQLGPRELVERANRIRARQGKSPFISETAALPAHLRT